MNFMRFSEARLHDELSTCMYSEHGFEALIRSVLGQVCQSLMIVSYWMPGSAQSHAASDSSRISSRAFTVSTTVPSVRDTRFQSASSTTACMNESLTRTELFAFWYCSE